MKREFYLYRGAISDYKKECDKKQVISKKLNVISLTDAYVLPVKFFREAGVEYAKGGVVDKNGNYVHSSGRFRDFEETKQSCVLMGEYEFSKKNVSIIKDPCIYCGEYIWHYGHFLCESMTRLWYVVKHYKKGTKLIFISDIPREIKGNYKQIFELLGIDLNDILIVSRVVQCRNLTIPDASFVFCCWATPEFLVPFRKISDAVKKVEKYSKIYLSRTHYKDRFMIGEEGIEKLFRQNGFHVLYPEELSLSKLIAYLKGARVVAGLSGTGLHNIIFANPKTHLIVLNRSNFANPVQEQINQVANMDVSYVDVHFNYLGAANAVFLVGITPLLKSFAKDQKWDVSTVSALTQKQLELYFKMYMKDFRREALLAGNNATLGDVWSAVLKSVELSPNSHTFVKLKYFLLSKICWGEKRKKYQNCYKNIMEKFK